MALGSSPRSINLLIPALKSFNTEETLTCNVNESSFKVETENVVFVTRIIDVAYPQYQQLIPKSFKYTYLINSDSLKKSINRMLVLADNNTITMKLDENNLTLSSQNPEGNSQEEIPIECTKKELDEAIFLNLNGRYLLDYLNLISESFLLNINNPNSPVVINPTEDSQSTYLLMPISAKNQGV